jgi:hypothetical protein
MLLTGNILEVYLSESMASAPDVCGQLKLLDQLASREKE